MVGKKLNNRVDNLKKTLFKWEFLPILRFIVPKMTNFDNYQIFYVPPLNVGYMVHHINFLANKYYDEVRFEVFWKVLRIIQGVQTVVAVKYRSLLKKRGLCILHRRASTVTL